MCGGYGSVCEAHIVSNLGTDQERQHLTEIMITNNHELWVDCACMTCIYGHVNNTKNLINNIQESCDSAHLL